MRRRAATVVGFIATAALLAAVSCTSAEPEPELRRDEPIGLLPTASASGTPTPTPSASAARTQDTTAADAADAADPAAGSGAAPKPTATPKPTRSPRPVAPGISGQVLAGGKPVTDAQVTIDGGSYHHNTTTSSQGRFQSAAPPGTYTVTASSASASGCGAKTVTVEPNAVTAVTITCSA